MTDTRTRHTAGQPTGGQFATEARGTDTGVRLDRSPEVLPMIEDWRSADRAAREARKDFDLELLRAVHVHADNSGHSPVDELGYEPDADEVDDVSTRFDIHRIPRHRHRPDWERANGGTGPTVQQVHAEADERNRAIKEHYTLRQERDLLQASHLWAAERALLHDWVDQNRNETDVERDWKAILAERS